MSEVALKKILTLVLIDKFPEIKEIKVREEYNEAYTPPRKEYIVYIGITYDAMERLGSNYEDLRMEVRTLSRYVIDFPREVIRNIIFFDPYS